MAAIQLLRRCQRHPGRADGKRPQNAATQGAYMIDAVRQIAERHPSIGDVRGIGLMIGVEFVKDHNSRDRCQTAQSHRADCFRAWSVAARLRSSALRLIPPLTISRSEVDEGLAMLEYVIGLAEKE